MWKCDLCGKQVQAGIPENKVTTEIRKVKYINTENNKSSSGTEIVKEIRICNKCKENNLLAEEIVGEKVVSY